MSSEPSPAQSYANHGRMVPGFHYVTGGLVLVFVVWSMWHAASTRSIDAHFQMLGAFGLLGTFWYTRAFPLKAQDRVIRLEERLRVATLMPEDLRKQAEALTAKQLIALRFASDAELPGLVRWVLTEKVTDSKLIKQRITTWRADHHRV
jgi:Family of unknown function (DUF6526)